MKVIICPTCRREAIGPPNDRFPVGVPVVMGRFTGGQFPVVVHCDRCKRSFHVDALAFNALPQITPKQVEDLLLSNVLGTPPGA